MRSILHRGNFSSSIRSWASVVTSTRSARETTERSRRSCSARWSGVGGLRRWRLNHGSRKSATHGIPYARATPRAARCELSGGLVEYTTSKRSSRQSRSRFARGEGRPAGVGVGKEEQLAEASERGEPPRRPARRGAGRAAAKRAQKATPREGTRPHDPHPGRNLLFEPRIGNPEFAGTRRHDGDVPRETGKILDEGERPVHPTPSPGRKEIDYHEDFRHVQRSAAESIHAAILLPVLTFTSSMICSFSPGSNTSIRAMMKRAANGAAATKTSDA